MTDQLPSDEQATATVLREILATLQGYYAHQHVRKLFGIEDSNPKILEDVGELIDIVSGWQEDFLAGQFRLLLDGEPQPQDKLVQFAHSLLRVLCVWESNTVSSVEGILAKAEPLDWQLERYMVACYVWPLYRYENRAKLGEVYLEKFPQVYLAESDDDAATTGADALAVANSLAQEYTQDENAVSAERRRQVLASLREHLPALYDLMLESLVVSARHIDFDVVSAALEERQ